MDKIRSVTFKGYKSFEEGTIDLSKNLVVIIGRNNAGKSSAVDVLQMLYDERYFSEHMNSINEMGAVVVPDKNDIEPYFQANSQSGFIPFPNDYAYGSKYIKRPLEGKIFPLTSMMGEHIGRKLSIRGTSHQTDDETLNDMWDKVLNSCLNSIGNTIFRRLDAERDITPEKEHEETSVDENGVGATDLIGHFLNDSDKDERIVESKLLQSLNDILRPDAEFDEIRIQRIVDTDKWEIYLKEKNQPHRFALSTSGSGLKTIILILMNLYVIPSQTVNKDKKFVYAFEEIENNLHPALQKRIFEFLYRYSIENDIRIFITTHSEAAINIFYGKDQASLYHVQKNSEGVSTLEEIDSYKNGALVLDDLGIKASDILQANGIIWVEGPSDRVYILKWLQVFTDFNYIEGRDFQFVYYGGRLLAHYSGDSERADDDLIHVLRVNRNSAIVIDSDRRKSGAKLNDTKLRVRKELSDNGMFCWITMGKEIENYVSADAINQVYGTNKKQIGQYELFPDYIGKEDKYFTNHKVDSARKFAEYITFENSEDIFDLKVMTEKLYREIEKWNS